MFSWYYEGLRNFEKRLKAANFFLLAMLISHKILLASFLKVYFSQRLRRQVRETPKTLKLLKTALIFNIMFLNVVR